MVACASAELDHRHQRIVMCSVCGAVVGSAKKLPARSGGCPARVLVAGAELRPGETVSQLRPDDPRVRWYDAIKVAFERCSVARASCACRSP